MSRPAVALPRGAPPRKSSVAPAALGRALPGFTYELGQMAWLAGQVIRRSLRRPLDYGPEFASQFRFAVRLGWFPLLVTTFAFSFGPLAVNASGFLELVGALDRLGVLFSTIALRETGPLVTTIVCAGILGTAMCADLGARKVREELDALAVLGVEPIKQLVVPRFLVLVAVALLFNSFAVLAGFAGGIVAEIQRHAPLGPFFKAFLNGGTTIEVAASYAKCVIEGAIIAIVCCYKGLTVSGGAEGVGRAVNKSVVICFLAIAATNYVFTQAVLAGFPTLTEVR